MNPPNLPLLIAHSLSYKRGAQIFFNELSFKILSGEALQISGPNGIGKSSLLKILAGLLASDTGNVELISDLFYLGHQLGLKKVFTVEENICFDVRYPKPNSEQIQSFLNRIGLIECKKKRVAELSQGQQQRLALGKCLLSKVHLWLLDEPFVGLDQKPCLFWQNTISLHLRQGGAIIICSHFPLTIPNFFIKHIELPLC